MSGVGHYRHRGAVHRGSSRTPGRPRRPHCRSERLRARPGRSLAGRRLIRFGVLTPHRIGNDKVRIRSATAGALPAL